MPMESIFVLKSRDRDSYDDFAVKCRLLKVEDFKAYLDSIPNINQFYSVRRGYVFAKEGKPGDSACLLGVTEVGNREYIYFEEYQKICSDINGNPDYVVTEYDNKSLTGSRVVPKKDFDVKYVPTLSNPDTKNGCVYEIAETPLHTYQLPENISIDCFDIGLIGDYVVFHSDNVGDYDIVPRGAFEDCYMQVLEARDQEIIYKNSSIF